MADMTIPGSLICPYTEAPEPEEIKRFRASHAWTLSDVGKMLAVSPAAVSKWESGDNRIKPGLWELLHIKARVLAMHRRR
jgi:DNA-binding transcriptional regulator YiaG